VRPDPCGNAGGLAVVAVVVKSGARWFIHSWVKSVIGQRRVSKHNALIWSLGLGGGAKRQAERRKS